MSKFVRDFCVSFKSLRYAVQDEDDENEPTPLLEYNPVWDPKTEAGRRQCLNWDDNHIIPALRKQFTFKGVFFGEAFLMMELPRRHATSLSGSRLAPITIVISRGWGPGSPSYS